ncbi:hypothetical protein BGZ47_005636 [Haplosporangium gracile]|nr:hypothetical protein BGZ47_005636 [Haplosporangium gracile]
MLFSGAATSVNLNYHDLDNILSQSETEHNWAQKETAIKTIGAACHVSIGHNQEYVAFIKSHRKAFSESLLTERTRLSGAACELVEKLSTSMGRDFSLHFPDLFTPALLKVCARTNKVMVTRAVKALQGMINAGCLPTLPKACQAFATNNKALRIACIGLIASCIAQFSSQELEAYLGSFEPVLKEGVSDAAPEVRDTSRKSFKVYAQKFPERSSALTATLPGSVLKYLLPDARSSASLVRPTAGRITPTSGRAEGLGESSRHQSSREGLSRTVPSRIGPVRARTTTAAEQSSTSFKTTVSSTPHAAPSSQPYGYSASQTAPAQSSSPHLGRSHGLPSRTGSLADTSDHSGHSSLRMGAQRSRTLSSNSLTSTSMYQRTPSINLATHGGPQRLVPSNNSFGSDSAKPVRPSTLSTRLSKTEPSSKGSRLSTISTHGLSAEREPMSASERAKAYSASLKNEMASRRAGDMGMRANAGSRRVVTDPPGYGVYGPPTAISTPASSTSSTPPVSAATSITSVSPASSSSTSPTTAHSPHHDQLFSSFRAPASPHVASSPPESCASPDYRHSTPPSSQHSDENAYAAPLSPTRMAQVSLEGSMEPQPLGASGSPFRSRESSQEPHLGHHSSGHSSHHGSSQLHETSHSEVHHDFEFSERGMDGDKDHDMTVPDHESLFGNTANYLQTEQEISALQQQTSDKSVFMEEDPRSIDHDQLAVKAYADDYEASLAAASCSSTSLTSSVEGEKSYAE